MNLKFIWSTLEESSEILFDNYGYPAADKAAEELSLPPGYYAWVTPLSRSFAASAAESSSGRRRKGQRSR